MTLIVPLSAGGPLDVLGRLLAQEYQARSGAPAVVDNRTGGAGNIGIDAVRRAAPDGTTRLPVCRYFSRQSRNDFTFLP